MPELQHLQEIMKEVDAAEVRQTPVITGDPKISGRMTHSAITSPKVRLSRNSPNPSEPLSIRLAKPLPPSRMRRIQVSKEREDMILEPKIGVGRALFTALDQFAESEHRPEFRTVPVIVLGWSGAGSLL